MTADTISHIKSFFIGLISAFLTWLPQYLSGQNLGVWQVPVLAAVGVVVNFLQGMLIPPSDKLATK